MLTLVTGGARSGKSTFAQSLCGDEPEVLYIATAQPIDHEMDQRIARHRQSRPAHWTTVEEPLNVPRAVAAARAKIVLLDCLTVWLSNMLVALRSEPTIFDQVEQLIAASANANLIVVTNEVGCGIVPETDLGRFFRDLQGFANQRLARVADSVYLVVCGIPLRIKPAI